ncbi:MAG: YeeE/YedE thiosulfate transporter family protein [Candidatus Eremiobacteraeota bacterium]|nr:YeeE/YedE thiosulfate transporter family protein [Candidatus Eremiobacteraeota bacterium]
MNVITLLSGVLFGFILSRVGATSYNYIQKMFLLIDLHLMGVIGLAVVVGALGIQVIKRTRMKAIDGKEIQVQPKEGHRGIIAGGLIFGVGWALTGSCPGTILSQIGEGKLAALFTFAGMLAGTYLFGVLSPRLARLMEPVQKGRK